MKRQTNFIFLIFVALVWIIRSSPSIPFAHGFFFHRFPSTVLFCYIVVVDNSKPQSRVSERTASPSCKKMVSSFVEHFDVFVFWNLLLNTENALLLLKTFDFVSVCMSFNSFTHSTSRIQRSFYSLFVIYFFISFLLFARSFVRSSFAWLFFFFLIRLILFEK